MFVPLNLVQYKTPTIFSMSFFFNGRKKKIVYTVLDFHYGIANAPLPGRVAQSVGHLTSKSGVLGSIWPHTFVSPSAFSRRAVVSYWRKYVHEVLVNRFGGLSLPRKSVVRLTDRPGMTLGVYRGRKTTIQQYNSTFATLSFRTAFS